MSTQPSNGNSGRRRSGNLDLGKASHPAFRALAVRGNYLPVYGVQTGTMLHPRSLFVAAAIATALPVWGQSRPTFDVASIKPNSSADFRGRRMEFLPGGRFVATNLPLLFAISTAWNVPFQGQRLVGGPDWIRSERFDIEAKAANDAARTDEMRLMLRTLLEDRFQLKMRTETKELPVFAVVAGKNGPKLEKSKTTEKDCETATTPCHVFTGGRGRGLHGQAVDMADLAMAVENWAERPVIDQTGIKGLFHIETKPWLPMTPGPLPPPGAKGEDGSNLADLPTLFGIFEQLGLKLEPQKATVDVFHIESIGKLSQN